MRFLHSSLVIARFTLTRCQGTGELPHPAKKMEDVGSASSCLLETEFVEACRRKGQDPSTAVFVKVLVDDREIPVKRSHRRPADSGL